LVISKIFLKTVLVLLLLFSFLAVSKSNNNEKDFSIISIKSSFLNEVENRLLKESILREFLKQGSSVVPQIKLDSYIFGTNEKIYNWKRIHSLYKKLKVKSIVYGRILFKGRKYRVYKQKANYKCIFFIYKKNMKKKRIIFYVKGQKNLYLFYQKISKNLVSQILKEKFF